MPIYEYRCVKCKCEFEDLIINGEEPIACPKCKSEKIERAVSISVGNVEHRDSKEYYKKVIKDDVKEIVDKIKSGDEDAAADILGEQALNDGDIKSIMEDPK